MPVSTGAVVALLPRREDFPHFIHIYPLDRRRLGFCSRRAGSRAPSASRERVSWLEPGDVYMQIIWDRRVSHLEIICGKRQMRCPRGVHDRLAAVSPSPDGDDDGQPDPAAMRPFHASPRCRRAPGAIPSPPRCPRHVSSDHRSRGESGDAERRQPKPRTVASRRPPRLLKEPTDAGHHLDRDHARAAGGDARLCPPLRHHLRTPP